MGDGVPGERYHAPDTDAASYKIGGAGVGIGFGQETRKDARPLIVAELKVVGGGEPNGVDQGVDSAKPIEVTLLEGKRSRLRSTECDRASVAEFLRLGWLQG